MLTQENWKSFAELVGIAAIVASLVFVGLQIRQAETIASTELINAGVERYRESKRLIIENAEIWHRGCAGEELEASEAVIFAQIVNVNFVDQYNGWRRLKLSSLDDADPQYLINRLAANIHRYPGYRAATAMRAEWDAEGTRYQDPLSGEFRESLAARLDELKSIEPAPSFDTSLCGR